MERTSRFSSAAWVINLTSVFKPNHEVMMNSQSAPTVVALARSPFDRAVWMLRERAAALLAQARQTVTRRDLPGSDDIAQMDSRMLRDIGVEAAFFPRIDDRRDAQFHRL
jgi:hypothetical protein